MGVPKQVFFDMLNLGWSVIPVGFSMEESGKVNKRPLVSWKKFMTKRATEEDVEAWFALRQPDGIGLVTGEISGVVGVDIDSEKDPISLSSSTVSKSAFSGGRHYFYKWSEEIRNTVRIDGMPIDFRGDGGFLVLPPSAFGLRKYEWESFDPHNLEPLPEEIKQMLTVEKRKVVERTFTGNPGSPFPDAFSGNRNDTATRVAGLITHDIHPRLWQTVGWETLKHWNDEQCDPPLPEIELRTTFDSVVNMQGRTLIQTQDDAIDIPKPMKMREVGLKRIEERKLEAIAPSTGYMELDNYMRGFVPGHLITFTGDTNVGKTQMCCNFAHRVSQQGKKVLYFALEPENTIVDYLASIRTGKMFSGLSNSDIDFEDPNIDIYSKEQIGTLKEMVKVVEALPRYDLVIIDHIGYFVTDTNNTNASQSNVLKTLAGLAKSKGTCILLVAHIRKRQNRNTTIHEDDISGSASFKQDSTEIIIVTRATEEDEYGNTVYTDEGLISVRKTKGGGGQGNVKIKFKNGSALVQDGTDLAEEMWK